jgi:hypothetical protein
MERKKAAEVSMRRALRQSAFAPHDSMLFVQKARPPASGSRERKSR